ncbi:MAG: hypothetical protein LBK58_08150 [Prevotellaceae bacterium]|jgi:hypothetical protein|nr:hypothetical protein [Prevotellaceae bacterium]
MNTKERSDELKRQAEILAIELACIGMKVGGVKSFEMMDVEFYQRINVRIARMNTDNERRYRTSVSGNILTVRREL